MLVVDNRWVGLSGIGRYAREVVGRLDVEWSGIETGGRPSAPLDFIRKSVSVNGLRPARIYSPGYNGFLRNIPQTVTVHDLIHLDSPGAAKYRPYYDMFLRPLIRKNRHVITISQTSKERIERWIGDPRVDVVVAGNGSSSAFERAGGRFEAARPYVLYVGNFKPHKNVPTIFRALKHMEEDLDLYVVSPDTHAAESLAHEQGVAGRVRAFSGLRDQELAALYRGARATLQPSTMEGFGLPALESALCGTPVIYFEGCESVREICSAGGVPVGNAFDEREWAEAVNSVADGATYPAGDQLAQKYSWDRVGKTVSEVLARYS